MNYQELRLEAPLYVHQKMCSAFMEEAKKHSDKLPKDIPECVRILKALEVLEELFPELKR